MVAEDPLTFDDSIDWPATAEGFERMMLAVLRRDHGFVPGPIFVREFASEAADLSVYLWGTYEDVIEDPDSRTDGGDHEETSASLHRYWMTGGNFVVLSGTDFWAGPDGVIHSS